MHVRKYSSNTGCGEWFTAGQRVVDAGPIPRPIGEEYSRITRSRDDARCSRQDECRSIIRECERCRELDNAEEVRAGSERRDRGRTGNVCPNRCDG